MPSATTRLPVRRLPQRTCVGCGTTANKRELVRVVRTPEGQVVADPTGKRAGRGAYLCNDPACWQTAVKKGRLGHSLKTKLSAQDEEGLLSFAASLGLIEGQA